MIVPANNIQHTNSRWKNNFKTKNDLGTLSKSKTDLNIVGDRLKPRNSIFPGFPDFLHFWVLIDLYTFCENLGTLWEIILGVKLGLRNN